MGDRINACARSLETTDFNRYDVVADNKLFKREISKSQYRCFLQQLIRTSDREVLKQFTDTIQNDLWESIRKDLKRIAKSRKLPASIKDLIHTMMKHEFSGRVVRGEATLSYNYDYLDIKNKASGSVTRERYNVHLLQAESKFRINIPFKDWRWKSQFKLTGKQHWGITSQAVSGAVSSPKSREGKSYQGIESDASIDVLKRDSSIKLGLDAYFAKYWNPLADRKLRSYGVGATLALRHIFKLPIALNARAKWSDEQYSKPTDLTYNVRGKRTISSNIELSYIFKKMASIVGLYEFVDKDETTSFYERKEYKHKPSILAHVKFNKGYIRAGGGAGVWRDSLRLLDEDSQTKSDGAEVHGSIKIFFRPKKWLSVQVNAVANANYSEGDFKGWFPSWSSDLSLMIMYGKIYFSITEGYHGHHKNLQQKQTQHGASTNITLAYRPSNNWNLSLYGYHYYSKQTGHQEYTEQTWTAALVAGARITKKPDLWFQLAAYLIGYEYKQDGYERDQINVLGMAYVKARF